MLTLKSRHFQSQVTAILVILAFFVIGVGADEILFYDDFPTETLDSVKWPEATGEPTIDDVGIAEPSESYSLRLNGESSGDEAIRSQTLDLSQLSFGSVHLNYWYELKGGGEHPEKGDDLVFSYWNGSDWEELKRHFGGGVDMTEYEEVVLTLPANALHADFALKISNHANIGNYDDWFVDNVAIVTRDLGISSTDGLDSYGEEGGPFVPSSKEYTLTNGGDSAIDWTASVSGAWLDLSSEGGTLNPGEQIVVEVLVNGNADTLPPNAYRDEVIFTNVTSGDSHGRVFNLYVESCRILVYTEYAGSREYANTLLGINSVSTNYAVTELADHTQLDSMLAVHDVFLIPEQGSTVQDRLETIGAEWSAPLQSFVNDGGVVVQCDGAGKYGILTGAGLMDISSYSAYSGTVTVTDPSNPIMQGMPEDYSTRSYSASYQTLETGVVAEVTVGAVVINRSIGAGNVVLIGHDYYYSNADQDRIVGNSVFNLPDVKDALVVEPSVGSASWGEVGGPFNPAGAVYTLSNMGSSAVSWIASASGTWLDLSANSGTLNPGETVSVQVNINSVADSLQSDFYTNRVTFSNVGSGSIKARDIVLRVGPKKILAYSQYAGSREYTNVLLGVGAVSKNFIVSELGDYTQLDLMLGGHDVLFIPEQGSADQGKLETIGAEWSAPLQSFVNDGGVVVQCDGAGKYGILTGAGLMDVSSYNAYSGTVTVTDPSNPIMQGMPEDYSTRSYSASYQTLETGVVAEATIGAVVINRSIGAGNVVLIGHDYYYSNADQDRIAGNSVFNLPDVKNTLTVSPSVDFEVFGVEGGPFDSSRTEYTLTNTGTIAADWTVSVTSSWLDVRPSSGTLNPGEQVAVEVSINATAGLLLPGVQADVVTFTNMASNTSETRDITVHIDSKKILVYTQYTYATSREYTNSLVAIHSVNGNYIIEELTDYTQLDSMLGGHDVLLIPDQRSTSQSQLETVGAEWSSTLQSFVHEGGVVIQCDAGGRYGILTGSGLMDISLHEDYTYDTVTITAFDDPIVQGVSDEYSARDGSVSYTTNETAVVAEGTTGAVVINKSLGLGNVVLIGHDYYYSNIDQDRILGNAVFNLDALTVGPSEGFLVYGNSGGAFTPSSKIYTVINTGAASVDWTASVDAGWINLSSSGGTLNSGDQVEVNISPNENADMLAPGLHKATLVVRNTTSGAVQTRALAVNILPEGMIFYDDFATTELNSGNWPNTDGVAVVNDEGLSEPSGRYSLNLTSNGLVQSRILNLSGASYGQVQLEYWYQRTGGGDNPESGNDLVFSYLNGLSWAELSRHAGSGDDMTQFERVVVALPEEAMHASFMLRIAMTGDSRDDWFVDDVSILKHRLKVVGVDGMASWGYTGGPFIPSGKDYTLTNNGPLPIDWTAKSSAAWLNVVPSGGTIDPFDPSVKVVVSINAVALGLGPGIYTDTLTFTDATNNLVQTRAMSLEIFRVPGEIEVIDSIAPIDDANMPYGEAIVGLPETEQVTIRNMDSVYDLIIENIRTTYLEDFEDGEAQGWQEFTNAQWEVVSGEYRAEEKVSSSADMQSTYSGQTWTDFTVQAVIRRTGYTGSVAALLFRATEDFSLPKNIGSSYAVGMDGNGYYWVAKFIDGVWDPMQSWTFSPYLKTGELPNTVTVTVQSSMIEVYFNGDLAWSGSDGTITGPGRIGLFGYKSPNGNTVHYFDDITVDDAISVSQEVSSEQLWYNGLAWEAGSPEEAPTNWTVSEYPGGSELTGPANPPLLSGRIFRLADELQFPLSIAPQDELTVDVIFDPADAREYSSELTIESNDENEAVVKVALSGSAIFDYLDITPTDERLLAHRPGGLFVPSRLYYQLTNNHPDQNIDWSLAQLASWLDVSHTEGTLTPGESVTVIATPNADARELPEGEYVADLEFTDIFTTLVQVRTVTMEVFTTPKIWATPDSLTLSVKQGQVTDGSFTIQNTGDAAMEYRLSPRMVSFGLDNAGQGVEVKSVTADALDGMAAGQESDLSIPADVPYAPGKLLVRFDSRATVTAKMNKAQYEEMLSTPVGKALITKEHRIVPGLCSVELPEGLSVEEAMALFNDRDDILYAQPDYVVQAEATFPNDPLFKDLWGMHNTGQSGGTDDADIDAPEAWDFAVGNDQIIVAVIDTGVDYRHPDLASNMWINEHEYDGKPGTDDDGNGYVDDIYGYDFVNGDGDPMDDHYHGTHCAGTIGAVGNNNEGVVGVCWNVRIMAVKFLNSAGGGVTSDAVDCIEYSVLMGAKVMSNSWGGGGSNQAVKDAIDAAGKAGVLFIAAAGNYSTDNDVTPHYPSSYISDNIISVMSTDKYDNRSSFSSYGATSVDIAAPGSSILSCEPGGNYKYLSGTSMATPHIAGACALFWSVNPFLHYSEIQQILYETIDPIEAVQGQCVSNGRLNLCNALLSVPQSWLTFAMDRGMIMPNDANSITITVEPESFKPGTYDIDIIITSNDLYTPKKTVSVAVIVEPDNLLVQPTSDVAFGGTAGGPILPESDSFLLENTDTQAIEWDVVCSEDWLIASPGGGSINPGQYTSVELRLSEAAYALPAGAYSTEFTFTNMTTGIVIRRTVTVDLITRDFFTELFQEEENDLSYTSLTFVPDGSASYYQLCSNPAAEFPTDTAGGTRILLEDDGYQELILNGSVGVSFFGQEYTSLFVGSNGYITFLTGDTRYSEGLSEHFEFPRISALFDDLSPNASGLVSWKELPDRVAVTFENVTEYQESNSNSFQIELFFDGVVRVTYLEIGVSDGLAGLSDGTGMLDAFFESDLSGYPPCDL